MAISILRHTTPFKRRRGKGPDHSSLSVPLELSPSATGTNARWRGSFPPWHRRLEEHADAAGEGGAEDELTGEVDIVGIVSFTPPVGS